MNKVSNFLIICTIVQSLQIIRPNAQWSLSGNSYLGLVWLDKTQIEPSLAEVNQGIATCQTNEAASASQASMDQTIISNAASTTDQKVNALIDILQTRNIISTTTQQVVTP